LKRNWLIRRDPRPKGGTTISVAARRPFFLFMLAPRSENK
jgi:hypothetical protein